MRNVRRNARRIYARTRGVDGTRIDVGGEDLDFEGAFQRIHLFAQQNRQRIGFLSRRTARGPNSERSIRRFGLEYAEQLQSKGLERLRITEKVGHTDQQIAK